MSVEANVITREKPNALLIPSDAVQESSVFVIERDRARRRKIEIGVRGTRMAEVLSGLREGERVIAPAVSGLADGARVRPTERPEVSR
jgi:multidrug efflux pump subunit AcrA (membrane-fusion protein)